MKFMPSGIQILFLGALLSALLSTSSGAILAPASVLGENLLKPLLRNPDDKKVLFYIRISVVLITGACIWMAIGRQNIFELVSEASAFSLVTLFIPLNAGLWWKRASAMGSHLSMISGLLVWIYFNFIHPNEIPSVWYGLVASMIGLLIGTLLYPSNFFKPIADQ
jgi:Na+/proline symporter